MKSNQTKTIENYQNQISGRNCAYAHEAQIDCEDQVLAHNRFKRANARFLKGNGAGRFDALAESLNKIWQAEALEARRDYLRLFFEYLWRREEHFEDPAAELREKADELKYGLHFDSTSDHHFNQPRHSWDGEDLEAWEMEDPALDYYGSKAIDEFVDACVAKAGWGDEDDE